MPRQIPDRARPPDLRTQRDRLTLLVILAGVVIIGGTAVSVWQGISAQPSRQEQNDADLLTDGGAGLEAGVSEIGGGEEADGTGGALSPTEATTTEPLPPPATIHPLPQEPGLAPVITRVETDDPVVFLTIDDGLTRDPAGQAEFRKLGMPASLFLINEPIHRDPEFFRAMPGTLIEAHTQTHANLTGLSEEAQRQEICGNADLIERTYGRRPVLFRPPGGSYNDATRRAAAACGMRAVVLWQENVNWDVVGFREVPHFRPGDIILMHFRPQFIQELNVIKQRVTEAGFRFALLEDYLVPETVPAGLTR